MKTEIVNALLKDSASVAVLPRNAYQKRRSHFKKKNIEPKVTEFATDAIALITNKQSADTVVNLEDVLKVLKGSLSDKISKLVFDNPNSSTVQYMLKGSGC